MVKDQFLLSPTNDSSEPYGLHLEEVSLLRNPSASHILSKSILWRTKLILVLRRLGRSEIGMPFSSFLVVAQPKISLT